ncbi:MAG: pyruvate dehydrogenase (acetyl-transferring) E1 component subunit alpha [Planctomycetaceae bacterium]|jgi:pyruvate dehydrogenase E1 component alpha subunit|nr:pyruvate dehydrogenase (acetyl-transferring) E1 component subunit alpha [Planctomycetaceae bacterium]
MTTHAPAASAATNGSNAGGPNAGSPAASNLYAITSSKVHMDAGFLNASGKKDADKKTRPSAALPDATLIKWLRDMILIREFENRCAQAYQQAKIGGFCHLYIGQEALAVGTIGSVNQDDPIVTAYRDHGHALARGMSARACMAEMFGRVTGCAKGKGGSMHMFDKPNWNYGGHGIVGAQTPLGAGLAFAAKYEVEVMKRAVDGGAAKRKVALCYLGDGALNQGALHEAMNLAGLWGLPVIYIVENNRYSMGTAIERGTTMAHDLTAKAKAYGIEGVHINGMDILDIYDQFKPLVDRCRENSRPAFVDLLTYRYQGHSMSDPQKYRAKDEVEAVKQRDSIALLERHLLTERRCLSEADVDKIVQECKAIALDSLEYAETAPTPEASELYSDVYINIQPNLSPTAPYNYGVKNPLL